MGAKIRHNDLGSGWQRDDFIHSLCNRHTMLSLKRTRGNLRAGLIMLEGNKPYVCWLTQVLQLREVAYYVFVSSILIAADSH